MTDTVAHYLLKALFKQWGCYSKRILIYRGSQLINHIWHLTDYSYENMHPFFFLNLHSRLHTVPFFLYFGYMILRGMLLSFKSFLVNTVTTTFYNYRNNSLEVKLVDLDVNIKLYERNILQFLFLRK